MTGEAEEILSFWIDKVGPDGWYLADAVLDDRIRERFLGLWERARARGLDGWSCQPRGSLALVILLDQFPRNMFRGDPRSFSTDREALAVAKAAIGRGFDGRVGLDARLFFYMPLMHSEIVTDQERAVRLYALHLGTSAQFLHARAHRAVIRRFGRFPSRNGVLGRESTPAEADWLASGGYEVALAEVA